MILIILAAVAVMLPALAAACGGCLPSGPVPALPTAQGRHARRWPPVVAMATTTELAVLYGRPYPEPQQWMTNTAIATR